MVRNASPLLAATLLLATTLPSLGAQKKSAQSNLGNLARLMSGDLPLPHDWLPTGERLAAASTGFFSFSFSFSFYFTEPPSAMATPAPSAEATPAPSAMATLVPSANVTPVATTAAPTEAPMMPVISIKLRMGGSRQQRQEAVNAIITLMAERLKVKGKIHIKAPGNTPGVPNNATNNASNGQGSNGGNGNNNPAPGNTTATNTTTAPTSSQGNNSSKIGKNGANGQESSENGKNGDNHARSTISIVQSSSNTPDSLLDPDERRSSIGYLVSSSSPSRISQATGRRALEEQGILCLEEAEQEGTGIDLENYAEQDKVQSVISGMRNGSIPLTLADGTPVRDTVCQANTTLSMVAVPFDEPADSSDETVAEEGWRLSTNYIIVISVLGGAIFLLVVFLLYRRRSARVTQI